MFVTTDNGVTCTEVQKLEASDGVTDDRFGRSVAVHGNTIVVGAYNEDNENGESAGQLLNVICLSVYLKRAWVVRCLYYRFGLCVRQ